MATRTTEAAKKPAGAAKHNMGKVVQVIGPVLDVEFEPERLPSSTTPSSSTTRGTAPRRCTSSPKCSSTSAATRCVRSR